MTSYVSAANIRHGGFLSADESEKDFTVKGGLIKKKKKKERLVGERGRCEGNEY